MWPSLIKLLSPFSTNAKVEVIKTPKIFFYDTGLLQILSLRTLQQNVLSSMFETSVFSELVKKYGRAHLNFWRTKNKHEINFILSRGQELIPIEVEESFRQIRGKNMHLFIEKYDVSKYFFAGIKGKRCQNCIYPWEV